MPHHKSFDAPFLSAIHFCSNVLSIGSIEVIDGTGFAKTIELNSRGDLMLTKTKTTKKNPLTKAQNKLLKDSLKKLLGNGLLEDQQKSSQQNELKAIVLKNALNGIVLE